MPRDAKKCSTVQAAWYSFRDEIGCGDDINMQSAFMAGAMWGFDKVSREAIKMSEPAMEIIDQLVAKAKRIRDADVALTQAQHPTAADMAQTITAQAQQSDRGEKHG